MRLEPNPSILCTFSGATVSRIVDRSDSFVPSHAHDWPVLSLFVSGSYHNRTEMGEAKLHRPSAIFYRQGARHENHVGRHGFEQIEIEFDPDWLGDAALPELPASHWTSGKIAALARTLAMRCGESPDEEGLRTALAIFFGQAHASTDCAQPDWLPRLELELQSSERTNVRQLGELIGRHPFWIGQAYKNATGETLHQAISRLRVERASRLLRETDEDAAAIAIDAGFCDQSHMIRTFRRVVGRTPSEVRADTFRDFVSPVA